jgi:hypothetical protein
MYVIRFFYKMLPVFFIFLLAAFVTFVSNVTASIIENDQENHRKNTGDYFQIIGEDFSIDTYETICRGYIVNERVGNKMRHTSYGDIQYSYETDIPTPTLSTTTATTTR